MGLADTVTKAYMKDNSVFADPSVLKSQNKKARISRRRTLESSWVLSAVYASFSYNSFSVF